MKRNQKKIRYAVVGLGHIAQVAVLPGFRGAQNSELVALVSGDSTKLKVLGKKYHVKNLYAYDEYEKCLSSGLIDAVYIALPNNLHKHYAQLAAEHGIHILVEKPMAMDERECISMMRTAHQNQVKFMVAYRLHFDPANLYCIDLISSGEIGEPRIFNSTFTQQVKDIDNIRLKKAAGGGPLGDIGIYCINAARYLFQDEPVEAFATEIKGDDPRFREVGEMFAVTLRFPKNRVAQFTASFGAATTGSYDIIGTMGSLRLENAYSYTEKMDLLLRTQDEPERKKTFKKHDQFAAELHYFSDCVLNNKEPEPSAEEGLLDVKIISALLESARMEKPVKLDYFRKIHRPSLDQEYHKAPHREPQTIHVKSPAGDQ